MRMGFYSRTLAYVLDSLVRVTRRVRWSFFGKFSIAPSGLRIALKEGKLPTHWFLFKDLNLPITDKRPLWAAYQQYISPSASFSTISSLLTLFSKFFSSFLHSTCSLSVSHKYLALEEVYLPFSAAVPSNATLRDLAYGSLASSTGVSPSLLSLFKDFYARFPSTKLFRLQFSMRFTMWAFTSSLAGTKVILVSFFSSAYWYA